MLLGDLFDLSLRGRADTAGLIREVAGLRELPRRDRELRRPARGRASKQRS
jgi:hypothetical protein